MSIIHQNKSARTWLLAAVLLLSGVLGGFAAEEGAKGPAAAAPIPDFYELSIRDQIQVTVYGEPDLTAEQRIDGRGQIRIPLLGTTQLAGMTVRQAEEYIQQTFIDNRLLRAPMVTVRVADYAPKEVSVLGAVASPGKLAFPIEANSLDIVDVISQMGGFEGIAKSDHVRVTRTEPNGTKTDFTVNVERMITGRGRGETESSVEILPGDVIWVPERLF